MIRHAPARFALAALLGIAAPAAGAPQDAAPKPPAPAPSPPQEQPEFFADAIRKPDGMVVRFYRVKYVDAKTLADELKNWLTPGAKAEESGPAYVPSSKSFPSVTKQTIRIEDVEENWPVLKRVLDMVDVPQAQVYVEAKIVEVNYTDDLRIGMEAHFKRNLADTFFQAADIRFPNRLDSINNQATATFRDVGKYVTFDYVLDLAQAGATFSVTSKPGIFASQGETAKIEVGEQEPVVQQQLTGTQISATTRFEPTGLILEVQPLLIGRDAIRARISAQLSRVSEFRITATSNELQVVNPVISKRHAETVLTVPDGETLVIGGLDQEFDRDESTGIPLLKDIPVIGFVFGSKTKRREHTELVFFLTFRILNPGEARLIKPPAEETRTEK